MAVWSFLVNTVSAVNLDIFFLASLAMLGSVALFMGSWFTYQAHFVHPQLSYVPVDEKWQQYLGDLVNQAHHQAEEAANPTESKQQSQEASIWVDISGAVSKPGVYAVDSGSRWQDVVLQAGGFTSEANQQFIHQQLNLSRQVKDQDKLYIPLTGEEDLSKATNELNSSEAEKQSSNSDSKIASNALINVNQATQSQLETLPNIGPKRAQDIILSRPYISNADFLERSGLSTNLAQELMGEMIFIE